MRSPAEPRRLEVISVREPCAVPWDTMLGGGAVRYCRLCRKNVYDLAQLYRDEAEELVFEAEGQLCLRFFRREDGTVVTKDCTPTRVERVRRLGRRARRAVGAALAVGIGALASSRSAEAPAGKEAFVLPTRPRDEPSAPQGMRIDPDQFTGEGRPGSTDFVTLGMLDFSGELPGEMGVFVRDGPGPDPAPGEPHVDVEGAIVIEGEAGNRVSRRSSTKRRRRVRRGHDG